VLKQSARGQLPSIPTPLPVRWREFRQRTLPVLVFVASLALTIPAWRAWVDTAAVPGIGEGTQSLVTSPQPGLVQQLAVRPWQKVNRGDLIAVIRPVDPRAQLDLVQAQIQLARLHSQPSLAQQNALDYERIRMDLLRTRAELAIAKVNLERAANDVARNAPLYEQRMVSEETYDLSLKSRQAYRAEVDEKSKAVAEMERRLQELRFLGEPEPTGGDSPYRQLVASISALHANAATNWGLIPLTAPITGMVRTIHRQPGEYVADGEPLVSIGGLKADHIVAYLRQPYRFDPQVGMKAKVATRTQKRQLFWTEIREVGAHVEVITNSLAFLRQGLLVDAGLPIILDVPQEARIRPGETVDIWLSGGGARK